MEVPQLKRIATKKKFNRKKMIKQIETMKESCNLKDDEELAQVCAEILADFAWKNQAANGIIFEAIVENDTPEFGVWCIPMESIKTINKIIEPYFK